MGIQILSSLTIYIYIYIYIEREREIQRRLVTVSISPMWSSGKVTSFEVDYIFKEKRQASYFLI